MVFGGGAAADGDEDVPDADTTAAEAATVSSSF